MEDYKNDTFWYPTKLFFAIKFLVDREFAPENTYTSGTFSCNMFNFSPYFFFKLILDEWYPLGLRLYVRTNLSVFEKEGRNESEQKFAEFKKYLRNEIGKKEQKKWKNLLGQYEHIYKEDVFSKLTFKIQCDEELSKCIRTKFISYLVKFSQDKLRSETGFTMIDFTRQMSTLLNLLKNKLSNGNSGCGLSLEEKELTSYFFNNKGIGTERLFPPFGKSYCFLELLEILDFLKIIRIKNIWFTTLDNPNELVHINLFSSNVDVLLGLKELDKLTSEGCKNDLLKLDLLSNEASIIFSNNLTSNEDKDYFYLRVSNGKPCRFKKKYRGDAEKYSMIKALVDIKGMALPWSELFFKIYKKYPQSMEEDLPKLKEMKKDINRKLRMSFGNLVKIEKENVQQEGSPVIAFALKVVIK